METMQGIALRGICASYFENNVSPILKYVQQAQEQVNAQSQDLRQQFQELKDSLRQQSQDLRDTLKQKADAAAVPSQVDFQRQTADLERLTVKVKAVENNANQGNSGVTMLARIQDLQSMLQKKVDIGSVPTMEQMKNIRELVQQKANTKDVEELAQKLRACAVKEARTSGEMTATPELTGELELASEEKLRALRLEVEADFLKQLNALRDELQARIAGVESRLEKFSREQQSTSAAAEVKKMQVVMSAASSTFNKQLKEVKQQVQTLQKVQERGVSLAALSQSQAAPDYLQRENSTGSLPDREETRSLPESDEGSMTGSIAGSTVSALNPEERAELKKIQAVVAAAGTVFNKELRDVRKQLRDVQGDVRLLKLGAGPVSC